MSARAAIAVAAAALLGACALGGEHPDNAGAMAAIEAGRSGGEVIIEGVVTHVARTTQGPEGAHEHFDVRIATGAAAQDILIADNVTIGTAAPVRQGDDVIVKGVLEIDPSGPVIHWTHHDPRLHHASGYVILHGKMYD